MHDGQHERAGMIFIVGDPNVESILMFVIGGDGPRAEFTDESMKELEDAGVWPKA